MSTNTKPFRFKPHESEQGDISSWHTLPFLTPYFAELGGEWGQELDKYMRKIQDRIGTIVENPRTPGGLQEVIQWSLEAAGLELVLPTFCVYNLVFAPSMPRKLVWDIIRILPPDSNEAYRLLIGYYAKRAF